jgi:hypothetical protein
VITHPTIAKLTASQLTNLDEREEEEILVRILGSPDVKDGDFAAATEDRRTRTRSLVAAGVVVTAIAAALVVLLGTHAAAPRPGPEGSGLGAATTAISAGRTLHARLLSAIESAQSDIVEIRSTIYPRPQYPTRIVTRWSNGLGTDVRTSDTGGDRLQPPDTSLTTVSGSGTMTITLYPLTKMFTEVHQASTIGNPPLDGASFRASIAGADHVIGSGEIVNGHRTIELTDREHTMVLWVDSSTYLPVRAVRGSGSRASTTDWTYYSPTSTALDQLRLTIPTDYRRVSVAPLTWEPKST